MRTEWIEKKKNYVPPAIFCGEPTYSSGNAVLQYYVEDAYADGEVIPVVQVVYNIYHDNRLIQSKTIGRTFGNGVITCKQYNNRVVKIELLIRDRYNYLVSKKIDVKQLEVGELSGE